MFIDKEPNTISYFLPSHDQENDKRVSVEITQLQKELKDVFNGIGCFNGIFSLQIKPGSKPYQAPLRYVANALQKPFEEELEQLQKARHNITTRHR